jgi:hypothetical protein
MDTVTYLSETERDNEAEWKALEAAQPFFQTMMGKSRTFQGPKTVSKPHPLGYRPDLPLASEGHLAGATRISKVERELLARHPVMLTLSSLEDSLQRSPITFDKFRHKTLERFLATPHGQKELAARAKRVTKAQAAVKARASELSLLLA